MLHRLFSFFGKAGRATRRGLGGHRALVAHCVLLGAAVPALAQESAALAPATPPWYRPRHAIVQTGSGLGMVSAGVGYTFLKDRLETDVQVGFVPKKHAGSTLTIPSLKLLYTPYSLDLRENVQLRPLTVGVYVSYSHGIINDDRGQYTKGYYWFSADTRVGPLLGGRITYQRPPSPRGQPRRISAFYELGSNDLYMASYFSNGNFRSLSPLDIMTLGVRLKADF